MKQIPADDIPHLHSRHTLLCQRDRNRCIAMRRVRDRIADCRIDCDIEGSREGRIGAEQPANAVLHKSCAESRVGDPLEAEREEE